MIGVHEKLKYGDIIYIEYFNQLKKSRIILTSSGFALKHKSYVDTKKMTLSGDSIYLKDFEDNLFILFPTMNENFLLQKSIIDDKIKLLKAKVDMSHSSFQDPSSKQDINKIITTFQRCKKEVYSENEKFIKQIGNPIKFGDNFILIHFKSQMFVTKYDSDALSNQKKNKLILTDYYTEDCIFLFSPYNNYDTKKDYVFSEQNLFIQKKEKNMWANNQYLKIKMVTDDEVRMTIVPKTTNLQGNDPNSSSVQNKNDNFKYLLTFTEDKSNANAFKIKICSNYIDPSSSNLAFVNPIWICCQNYDKYLIITPKKKEENELGSIGFEDSVVGPKYKFSKKSSKALSFPNAEDGVNDSTIIKQGNTRSFQPNYSISFASIDREKAMNNIYGLFNVEQVEGERTVSLKDQYLKDQLLLDIDLRVSPRIEYNKKIRFRHVATKKYLGLEEKIVEVNGKKKNIGVVILEDIPNEKCDWIFMESYIIIDIDKYQKAKEEGIKATNNEYPIRNQGEDEKENKKDTTVKKKEILRIFHLHSQKFLSFDELTRKILSEYDDRQVTVRNLSLNKNPYDSDLVRLLPSNETQSWEIHLVLYFNSVLCKQILNCNRVDVYKYIGGDFTGPGQLETIPEDIPDPELNPGGRKMSDNLMSVIDNKENIENEIKIIRDNANELRLCFENLRDFCLNEFSRKFDITASLGKPVFYRQEFLFDQGFLEKTFQFLTIAKKFSNYYSQYVKIAEQNMSINAKEIAKSNQQQQQSEKGIGSISRSSTKKKNRLKKNNNLISIGEFFKEINLCVMRSFEFISAMCKNHSKNKEYVFKHREIFWDYLLQYKEASECLIDIIKENENLMNEVIKENIIDNTDGASSEKSNNLIEIIINYLTNNEKYDLYTLGILSHLVRSKDKGITSNQEYIFNCLFEEKQDKFLIKVAPQFDDTVFHVVYRNENKEYITRTLLELTTTKNNLSDYEKNIVLYIAQEFNLYADLCYGRNYVCIDKIRSLFPLDHLIHHISNIDIHEEILGSLINILNFVYIDIEPHSPLIYPSMIKIVTNELKVEKLNKTPIKTYIPLDKLNLILCNSLFILHNIKNGKVLVNSANINLIFNIIQFRLYENVEYKQGNTKEVLNEFKENHKYNLKEEIKKASSEFYDKIGYKFVEFDFEHEIGPEYLIFVLDHINDFFLNRVIIDNIDTNMDNKNIIVQMFKTVNKTDLLTQNNINYLMKILIELKYILTSGNKKKSDKSSQNFLPIIKQISKVIEFILDIKKEDMINKILENLMSQNKIVIHNVLKDLKEKDKLGINYIDKMKNENIYEICEDEFNKIVNFKEVMMENEYYLYQLFNEINPEEENLVDADSKFFKSRVKKLPKKNVEEIKENSALINEDPETQNYQERLFEINYENQYLNSITFKTLQELIIRILEVNVDERVTKILVRLFTRIHSQRKEIIECIKNTKMLYGEKDLKKYLQCRTLIKRLALLTEKTEIWMSPDQIPLDKLATKENYGFKNTWDFTMGQIDDNNEENFENVIKNLNLLIKMCYRKNTQNFKKYEKLKLMQTIFFSMQLDEVLFSLIREISQVFPTVPNEDDVKEKYFRKSLEILLKQIFKLLTCMIHNTPEFQETIKGPLQFCKSFNYLNDLGLINLISEMICKSESFISENIKFIMDIIIKEFNVEKFINVFKYFNVGDDKIEALQPKKEYQKEIKKCTQILRLVKSSLMKIKETKYLNIIISNFEEIMKQFPLFCNLNFVPSPNIKQEDQIDESPEREIYTDCPTMRIIKISSSSSNYKMKMLHYLTKIAYQLIKMNEKLKGLILKLFPLNSLYTNILKINLPLDSNMMQRLLDITTKSDKEKIKKDHCIESQLRCFYKLKYNGFVLFILIGTDFQRMKGLKQSVQNYFQILDQDVMKYYELKESLSSYYEPQSDVIILWKKNAYKYFFKGIFPVIYQLASVFKKDFFKSNNEYLKAIENYKAIMKRWKKIFVELVNDRTNVESFFKVLNYIQFNKDNFKDFFYQFNLPLLISFNHSEPKVDKYYKIYTKMREEKKSNKNKNEITLISRNKRMVKKQLAVGFTEDFINRIENNRKVSKYVKKEIKILSKKIKSKINFHKVMQMYINEHSTTNLVEEILYEQESNFHLLNIFIKFIQENYLSTKYYQQITFLIEFFSYFIEVKPLFLKSVSKESNYMKSNYYIKNKTRELNENFLVHCQKIFLNNGSVEIFLKIVCEGNKKFINEMLPSVLYFFNNVLDGGNRASQEKFYQLFTFFPNSDNLFFNIKQLFSYDIYQNLHTDISIKEPKIDTDNLTKMINLLKFLQLLTENHFTNLQVFLRNQASNRVSYNFIIILVDYMNMLLGQLSNIHEMNQILTKYATELYYRRMIAVLETLCEFLQGPCEENQEMLINSKIIEIFVKILRETELENKDNKTGGEMMMANEENEDKENLDNSQTEAKEDENDTKSEYEEENDSLQNEKQKFDKTQFIQVNKLFYLLDDYQKSLLIYKIGLVLLAIIEGRKNMDNVIKKILRDFDYKLLYDKINEMYMKLKDKMDFFMYSIEEENSHDKIVAEAGFNLYFFVVSLYSIETEETEFKKLSNLIFKEQHKLSKIERESLLEMSHNVSSIQSAVLFFKNNSLNIEIVKENQVLRVFCPKLTFFKGLTPEMITSFQERANRTSIQTKLNALLAEKDELYQTLMQLYKLELFFKKSGPLQYFFMFPEGIQIISLILGIIVNVFILLGYNIDRDEDQKDVLKNVMLFGLGKDKSAMILKILGAILVVFSALIFCEFLTRRAPIIFRRLYLSYLKDLFEEKAKKMSVLEIRRIDKILTIDGLKDFLKKMEIYFRLIINKNVLYALAYILFALLGLLAHNFFFAFHLIEFIKMQPVLLNVLRSVTEPLSQLIYTFIFFIILVYFYSLIIFYSFYDIMPENSCNTVVKCLAAIYSNTFTSGGNLGNFIDSEEEHMNDSGDMVRYVLDLSFTIIMVWMVFQLVSGLILDTFGSLRKMREEMEDNIQNICFICGLEREKIEKYYLEKDGFNRHLQEHDIASYLFYIFYLQEKSPSEYSGIESYVKEEINKESISWFPIKKCIVIEEWIKKHKAYQ